MSNYEDYTSTSKSYDETRETVGEDTILDWFAKGKTPLNEMVVLDAGSGTGTYSAWVLNHVHKVEAVELNLGMIERAREKLSQAEVEGRIEFHHASLDAIPLENGSIDAIMVNQVLHHFPQDSEQSFSKLKEVVKEFHRVLKPGGVLVIHTCSQQQLKHGYWYASLIQNAFDRISDRYIPIEHLSCILDNSGFTVHGQHTEALGYQGESLFGPKGPLDASWRDGDSVWSLTTPEELEAALSKVRALTASGDMQDYIKSHDQQRPSVGQIIFLHAIKHED